MTVYFAIRGFSSRGVRTRGPGPASAQFTAISFLLNTLLVGPAAYTVRFGSVRFGPVRTAKTQTTGGGHR